MNRFSYSFLLLLFAVFNCAAQTGIRAVDFRNFTYQPHCAGEEPKSITVKNGEYSMEKQMPEYVDRLWFSIFEIAYGDLDGDMADEAAVLSVCNTGGTGNFSEGFVYKFRNGRPSLLTRIAGGDRAYGGLRTVKIAHGILTVERNDPGENGASCCPEFIETQNYKIVGGRLVEMGKATKRPAIRTERISFDPGTSGKTLTVNVPENERVRYIVGARAGQRLTVSAGVTDAQVRLLGDARVTEGVNNFLAVLSKTGDYTIEIFNPTDKPISIVLNIKIE